MAVAISAPNKWHEERYELKVAKSRWLVHYWFP